MIQEEETKREGRKMPMKAVTPSEHRQTVAHACQLLEKLEGGPHHRKYHDELEALTDAYARYQRCLDDLWAVLETYRAKSERLKGACKRNKIR